METSGLKACTVRKKKRRKGVLERKKKDRGGGIGAKGAQCFSERKESRRRFRGGSEGRGESMKSKRIIFKKS